MPNPEPKALDVAQQTVQARVNSVDLIEALTWTIAASFCVTELIATYISEKIRAFVTTLINGQCSYKS